MSARTPNEEQKKAIEHHGGVLLSAGAGSGKTFVLVEHIIYLLKELEPDCVNLPDTVVAKKISEYLRTIILMTFTKKAAGELSIRMEKRVEEQISVDESRFFRIARKEISALQISTIHGFCYRLIKEGLIPNSPANLDIVDDFVAHARIKSLVNEAVEDLLVSDKSSSLKLILSLQNQIVESFVKIFSTPELRLSWEREKSQILGCNYSLRDFFNEWKVLAELEEILDGVCLSEFCEFKDKSWYKYLDGFNELISSLSFDKVEDFEKLNLFFKNRMSSPRGNSPELDRPKEIFEQIKKLKKKIVPSSKNSLGLVDHLQGYYGEKKEGLKNFADSLYDIFEKVNDRYFDYPGITFSDIEYISYKGLIDKNVAKEVLLKFNYFIIDEFQDTSFIQYDIVRSIINQDFSKVFCVGDLKQAIYGFRGGEVAVFRDCAKRVPTPLQMSNNYRSTPSVVKFNNEFFAYILPKAKGYKDVDPFSVDVVSQTIPDIKRDREGSIIRYPFEVEFEDEKTKLTSKQMNEVEAQLIVEILKDVNKGPDKNVAILYKKLSPLQNLLPKLIENNFSFRAQVKIPFGEDPIALLAIITLEAYVDKRNLKYALVKLYEVCLLLEIDSSNLEDKIQAFWNLIHIAGLTSAFDSFIFSLNIRNSNFEVNASLIKSVMVLSNDNPKIFLSKFLKYSDHNYSLEFEYGDDSPSIFIMTAHASKGLEFPHVILGGMATNGRSMRDFLIVGLHPGSFRYRADTLDRQNLKTPQMILEELISEQKDFSESKRLFYVAATRAQESLHLPYIECNEKLASSHADGWINALDLYVQNCKHNVVDKFLKFTLGELAELKTTPLFHKDKIGISQGGDSNLIYTGELSVTRLSLITQCPYKFYLQNVIQLSRDNMDAVFTDSEKKNPTINYESDELETKANFLGEKRAMERGSNVHLYLHEKLTGKEITADIQEYEKSKLEFIVQEIQEVQPEELLSEFEMKFHFFDLMITGIADLILKVDGHYQVWDFKTGKPKETEEEESYWFQLSAYAYALWISGKSSKDSNIVLALYYVDKKNKVTREYSFDEVEDYLKKYWKKSTSLHEQNKSHCEKCHFQPFCE